MPAARAARCAGEQGKFWDMRMSLMKNAHLLTSEYISKTATDLKLDMRPFTACSVSSKYDAEIQAEMQEGTRLGVGGTPTFVMGKPDAPLTMVEFTDLQCPFCRQFVTTSFDEIKKNWIDTGKLRYISRDFPLDFHAQAMPAARAARCAGEQGKFWEMRLGLMRNANLLTAEYITKTANDLKLEPKGFAACNASTKYDADIQAESAEGTKLGVGGTPTFIIGRTTATAVEGPILVGALPYAQFDEKLKILLSGGTR